MHADPCKSQFFTFTSPLLWDHSDCLMSGKILDFFTVQQLSQFAGRASPAGSETKSQIPNLVKMASKIMGTPAPFTAQDLFEQAIRQTSNIQSDKNHVLFCDYVLPNWERSYRVALCKHNSLKHVLSPHTITMVAHCCFWKVHFDICC